MKTEVTISPESIQHTRLENGIDVITEYMPAVRSVSIGVWLKAGSRYEAPAVNGVAHFLEHMMFKGTERRTPLQIARSLESLGGHLNAFTSKDLTCYYAEVLDEHLKHAVDILADILLHSTFPEREMEKERSVILDEIQSVEDTPEEAIQDYLALQLFLDHPLGRPILGKSETVSHVSRDDLIQFYRNHYVQENVIIAAAGNVAHEELVDMVATYFQFPKSLSLPQSSSPTRFGQGVHWTYRPINQAHLMMGFAAPSYGSPEKPVLYMLNTLLGGGMSSRLFQNIREKHGVAYSIYSFTELYADVGILGIYLGTDMRNLQKARQLLDKEIQRFANGPISRTELEQTRNQIKGGLVLSLESAARRMSWLARQFIYTGKVEPLDAALKHFDTITQETIWEFARNLLKLEHAVTVGFLPEKGQDD